MLGATTLSITTLSIKDSFIIVSNHDPQYKDTQHNNTFLDSAECCILFFVVLSVIMLGVIMLNVVMLSVAMLSVIMLNVVAPSLLMSRGSIISNELSKLV